MTTAGTLPMLAGGRRVLAADGDTTRAVTALAKNVNVNLD